MQKEKALALKLQETIGFLVMVTSFKVLLMATLTGVALHASLDSTFCLVMVSRCVFQVVWWKTTTSSSCSGRWTRCTTCQQDRRRWKCCRTSRQVCRYETACCTLWHDSCPVMWCGQRVIPYAAGYKTSLLMHRSHLLLHRFISDLGST